MAGEPVEARYYLALLRRRLSLVVTLVIVALATAWLVTPKTHEYTSRTVIYVGATNFAVTGTEPLRFDPTLIVERLMQTYADMLRSEPVAQSALQLSRVPRTQDEAVREIKITPGENTQLLTIAVTDRNALVAQQLANGMADAFMQKVQATSSPRGQGSLPSVPAYVFQRADFPEHADSTGLLRNLALAGFFGLLVAVGVVLLLDHLDLTIKNRAEVERRLELPALGFIPFNSLYAAGLRSPVGQVGPAPRQRPRPSTAA